MARRASVGLRPRLGGDALVNLRSTHRVRVNTQRHLYFRGLGGSAPAARAAERARAELERAVEVTRHLPVVTVSWLLRSLTTTLSTCTWWTRWT